uniref:Uncharacterized protein n=1 Tax=Pararge aegeria TaxID=116150 RepID=S4PAD0_9NEOP
MLLWLKLFHLQSGYKQRRSHVKLFKGFEYFSIYPGLLRYKSHYHHTFSKKAATPRLISETKNVWIFSYKNLGCIDFSC